MFGPHAAGSIIVHTIHAGRFLFDCTVSLTAVCGQQKESAVMVFILSKLKCFFRLLQSAALQQGKEFISHIDVLRRILLPSSRGNQTIWMVPFPAFGFPLDGFLLFLLYPFQNLLFSWKPWIPALPCQIVVYRRYPAVASFPSMPLHQSYSVDSPH